jgi:hypothetical protein
MEDDYSDHRSGEVADRGQNVLLTLMIVVRLILHSRNTQSAMGAPVGINGLYKAIVVMLVESSALYAICSLLLIIPWASWSFVTVFFIPIIIQIQVRGVFTLSRRFLIVLTNRLSLHSSSFYGLQNGVRS